MSSSHAAAVHGIAEDDLAGAPILAQVWPAICWALGQGVITAYNADFDRAVLARSCVAARIEAGEFIDARRWLHHARPRSR